MNIKILFQTTKMLFYGDISCNIPMKLSRFKKYDSYKLANFIVSKITKLKIFKELITFLKVAKPGFINIYLKNKIKFSILETNEKIKFKFCYRKNVLIEFVSANPTGPLHIGHVRQAVLGNSIYKLYKSFGFSIQTEFYYNDTGKQIENLVISINSHLSNLYLKFFKPFLNKYKGSYLINISKRFLKFYNFNSYNLKISFNKKIKKNLYYIKIFSVNFLRFRQDLDLEYLDINFDSYYLESSLYKLGNIKNTVNRLLKSGYIYEHNNALWLCTTFLINKEDKDRVIFKNNRNYTYFLSDISYHTTKWKRKFYNSINIHGIDHQSTINRVKAGLKAIKFGISDNFPTYILHKMVKINKNEKEIKISKRSGDYLTMRDLINILGKSFINFFCVQKKFDKEFLFDISNINKKGIENPVYYIKCAFNRILLIFKKSKIKSFNIENFYKYPAKIYILKSIYEIKLIKNLCNFIKVINSSINEFSIHYIINWLYECSNNFYKLQSSEKILLCNMELKFARLKLLSIISIIFKYSFKIIGIFDNKKIN